MNTYTHVGDYLIPNLTFTPEEAKIKLGKRGMLYKTHLEKHNKPLFNSLLIKGELYQHCADVENQAREIVLNELVYTYGYGFRTATKTFLFTDFHPE